MPKSFAEKIMDVVTAEVIEGIFFFLLLVFLNKFAFTPSLEVLKNKLSMIVIIVWIIIGIITIIFILSEWLSIER